ncbi:MAG: cytochrome C [Gammaproteobacteria bacterium]|uniref:Cytochrome C n=1 Tax=Candidatus Thiopontia autotrophica TaxID=2841688 RepID=A0A8J6PC01_9GAMM|nr:cytochrome C [Candidatus Thiopontia autotrophica]MBL6968609.1 cytochrome C [Gammaproteobacteria bacterium]
MSNLSTRIQRISLAILLGLFTITTHASVSDGSSAQTSNKAESQKVAKKLIPNKKCNKCHADEDEKTYILGEDEEGPEVFIYVDPDKFEGSVHGKQNCVGCHTNITLKKGEHEEELPITVGCIQCHTETMEEQENEADPKYKRLNVVLEQIDSYMHSVHAQPNIADQSRTNATCHDCHDAHNIGTLGSEARADHRLNNPEVCGRCHEEQKDAYMTSIHGKEVVENRNSDAAVCSDCHTTHNIESPDKDSMKLAITQNCGSCHEESLNTYVSSYHGQVNRLGYTNTAKCFDCHGSHALKEVDDPTSMVHLDNRLETCNKCHEDAPDGFLGFYAHGNADDYERYPDIYIVTKFMNWLIIGVFLFFWTHVILWFYREYSDRRKGKGYKPPPQALIAAKGQVYFRRFTLPWRIIHLLFALSTMTLALTGSTLLFSHTDWAPVVISMLGGPEVEAIIHRTAAVTWLSVFMAHFTFVVYNIFSNRKSFRWFGPTSMIPNWQDLRDVTAMFRWFFGMAERPNFDRWSYWQKFDYWAPFWGAAIIGFSGIMLFAPKLTAIILPGYVFNIATIIHAEEALLATIFLFTVHFFNVHFRPDKFPMSTTIFTGLVPLDEYKHEHKLEYERLKASGELEKHLVKRMPKGIQAGSNLLGAILIFFGLTLLTLVIIGYLSMH